MLTEITKQKQQRNNKKKHNSLKENLDPIKIKQYICTEYKELIQIQTKNDIKIVKCGKDINSQHKQTTHEKLYKNITN